MNDRSRRSCDRILYRCGFRVDGRRRGDVEAHCQETKVGESPIRQTVNPHTESGCRPSEGWFSVAGSSFE